MIDSIDRISRIQLDGSTVEPLQSALNLVTIYFRPIRSASDFHNFRRHTRKTRSRDKNRNKHSQLAPALVSLFRCVDGTYTLC